MLAPAREEQRLAQTTDSRMQDSIRGREPFMDPLASVLQRALPTGSSVSVRWKEATGGMVASDCGDVQVSLRDTADALMGGAAGGQPDPHRFGLAWTTRDGTPVVIAALLSEPLAEQSLDAWSSMAQRVVESYIATARAHARAEQLEQSERLQQALYEIADLSGSDLEMAEMLRRIHAVVGGLMYAENFYIVLYDDASDAFRFLYFADRIDTFVADPTQEISASESPNSLTMALLHHGEP